MAGRRLSMRKIKEILRLKWECNQSNKQIANSCKIARSTVREYLERATRADLSWPLDPDLDDSALETLLFPVSHTASCPDRRQMPPMDYLYQELKKNTKKPIPMATSTASSATITANGSRSWMLRSDKPTGQERNSLSTMPGRLFLSLTQKPVK